MSTTMGETSRDRSQSRYTPIPLIAVFAVVIIWGPPVAKILAIGVVLAIALWEYNAIRVRIRRGVVTDNKLIELALLISFPASIYAINRLSGETIVAITIICTCAADVFAYYGGRKIGRHRLAPSISPGKTVEGSIVGLVVALAVGVGINVIAGSRIGWPELIVSIIVINIAGQLGDLNESKLKRAANVSDSGRLLKGHGGVLDRIDAEIAALAAMTIMVTGSYFMASQFLPH